MTNPKSPNQEEHYDWQVYPCEKPWDVRNLDFEGKVRRYRKGKWELVCASRQIQTGDIWLPAPECWCEKGGDEFEPNPNLDPNAEICPMHDWEKCPPCTPPEKILERARRERVKRWSRKKKSGENSAP